MAGVYVRDFLSLSPCSPSAALMISQVWCQVSKHLLNLAPLLCDGRVRMSKRLFYTAANQPLAPRCTPFHSAVGLSRWLCPIKVNGVEAGLLLTIHTECYISERSQGLGNGNAESLFFIFLKENTINRKRASFMIKRKCINWGEKKSSQSCNPCKKERSP